jgi:U3 small nucleolar RNA-associated protein 19
MSSANTKRKAVVNDTAAYFAQKKTKTANNKKGLDKKLLEKLLTLTNNNENNQPQSNTQGNIDEVGISESSASQSDKLTGELISQYEQSVLLSKSNANNILILINYLENNPNSANIQLITQTLQSLHRIFAHFSNRHEFSLISPNNSANKSAVAPITASAKFQSWLSALFQRYLAVLYTSLRSANLTLQLSALRSSLYFVKIQAENHFGQNERGTALTEPKNLFYAFIIRLFLNENYNAQLQEELVINYINQYDDLRLYSLKLLKQIIAGQYNSVVKAVNGNNATGNQYNTVSEEQFITNIFQYLLALSFTSSTDKYFIQNQSEISDSEGKTEEESAVPMISKQRRALSELWLALINRANHSLAFYKLILSHLHVEIFPAVLNPLVLADFLTDSYNKGGLISLLSLNALFILISKYNLDYPHFFKKLYALCKPFIFHVKWRARFFQLLSLFLTSSYLPATYVSAFAKRFARLALQSSAPGAVLCVVLIYNLLRKHPQTKILIHKQAEVGKKEREEEQSLTDFLVQRKKQLEKAAQPPNGTEKHQKKSKHQNSKEDKAADTEESLDRQEKSVETGEIEEKSSGEDPFNAEEDDPELSGAQNSSLWELSTLCSHYCPLVSQLASVFLAANAPKKDFELSLYLQGSYESLITAELERRKNQRIQLSYDKPTGLFTAESMMEKVRKFAAESDSEEEEENGMKKAKRNGEVENGAAAVNMILKNFQL